MIMGRSMILPLGSNTGSSINVSMRGSVEEKGCIINKCKKSSLTEMVNWLSSLTCAL